MFRKKTLAAVAAAAALALGLSACGGSSRRWRKGGEGGGGDASTLTLGLIAPPTTFKPADIHFANESPYGQAVYDSLLKAEPDGTIVANLATEWEYNADNTVLTMTLRDDVKFTDGTPFNAEAAAQNLIRFRDGASPNKSFLASLQDAKAVDATHLEMTLTAVRSRAAELLDPERRHAGKSRVVRRGRCPDQPGRVRAVHPRHGTRWSGPPTPSRRTRTTGIRSRCTTTTSRCWSCASRPPC